MGHLILKMASVIPNNQSTYAALYSNQIIPFWNEHQGWNWSSFCQTEIQECWASVDELHAQANKGAEAENLEARGTTPFNGELTESMTWTGQELTMASSDHLLQSTAPVRDMIVVKDSKFSPDPFLLLLCGDSPTSTLRK